MPQSPGKSSRSAFFLRPAGPARVLQSKERGHSMKSNVVLIDRTARVGVGMLALASPLLEIPSYPFNLLGLVLLATGLVGYCPLYSLFTVFAPKRATTEHSG